MTRERFDIAYAAYTASCTFLLDEEGICRRVVMNATSAKRRDDAKTASRCMGAQYVASLDARAAGSLVEMPRVGASMLFARVDARGRVSLVRTGIVTNFETNRTSSREPTHDPFAETDGVRTSAPDVAPTPRSTRSARPSQPPPPTFENTDENEEAAPATERAGSDPIYFDTSDRTQRLPAVRPEPLPPPRPRTRDESVDVDVDDLATAEYPSAPELGELPPRTTLPSNVAPTLRRPHATPVPSSDEVDIYAAKARASVGRRSDPGPRIAARADSAATTARAVRVETDEAPRSGFELSPRHRG